MYATNTDYFHIQWIFIFLTFQDEKNQVLVTNIWLDQVRQVCNRKRFYYQLYCEFAIFASFFLISGMGRRILEVGPHEVF